MSFRAKREIHVTILLIAPMVEMISALKPPAGSAPGEVAQHKSA